MNEHQKFCDISEFNFFFTCGPNWTQVCSHVGYIPVPIGLYFL